MLAAARAPRRTLAGAAVLLLAAAALASEVTHSLQPFSSDDPGSQSVAARSAIERATGIDPYFGLTALVRTPAGPASASSREAVANVARQIATDPLTARVSDYYSTGSSALRSLDGREMLVVGSLRARSISSQLEAARRVRARLSHLSGVTLGGLAEFYAQGNDTAQKDLIRAELIAFPLLLLLALWVFRGAVAAALPLLIGALAIVGTLAVLRLLSEATNVSIYALNITSALGLGLAVDYSLLIVSRYREELAARASPALALARTMRTAGRTIAFSSVTIAGVMSCLLVFPQAFLRSIGFGGIVVAAIAGASSLLVLPAMLMLLSSRIAPKAAPGAAEGARASAWERISRLVVRRPVPVALAAAAFMLGLGAPVLGLRITQVDANVVPAGSGARVVDEAVAKRFPASASSPIFVVLKARASPGELAAYAARLRATRDVAAVEGPIALAPGEWQLNVAPASPPLSAASQSLVRAVRALPAPGPVLAGGEGASLVDLKHSLAARLPFALLILVLATAGAVFVMTRSALLPLLALLASLLTIAATFGALVLVFQNGGLEGFFGYTSSHALEASTLVLIFAMSFGLATDYGIFLLSRIRELRERGATNADAVAVGVERTGRIVTAAALLLCVALGSLMSARHALVKEVGFGAALAVAVDATAVRALLLPALVRLCGEASWHSPAALARALFARRPRPSPDRHGPASGGVHGPASGGLRPPAGGARAALAASEFCDHDHVAIGPALASIAQRSDARDERALAVAAFEFVRDEITYTFGPWGVPASHTLERRAGMCTNKANLLVALFRRAGIPAAYGVLSVNAQDYFGVVGPRFLTGYMSPTSTHVYAAALLDGRWVKCDPSTDVELASRTAHFCKQTMLIEWDGVAHATDFLDPQHVYADHGLFADIDDRLRRPARGATPERLVLWNDYLAFIRREAAFESSEALTEAYKNRRETHLLLGDLDGVENGKSSQDAAFDGPQNAAARIPET